MWVERYPRRAVPSRYLILRSLQNLRDFGQFIVPYHAQDRGNPPVSLQLRREILAFFEQEPRASTRDAGRHFGIGHMTVWRVLHQRHHPFHYQRTHDLLSTDYEARVNFCRWFLANSHEYILWTDEALFTRVGLFNVHNEHWWAVRTVNPHKTKRDSFQTRFSWNVWAGIVGGHLIGPHFIRGRLTGATYLEMLRNEVEEMLDDVPLNILRQCYWQLDGAPPHFEIHVRQYLNEKFGERWIGRGGPVAWPPRSPD